RCGPGNASPELALARTEDRRKLLLTLAAGGVTLVVALSVLGIPVVDACNADPNGLISCVRDILDKRFNLPGAPPKPPGDVAKEPAPAVADAPTPDKTPKPAQSETATVVQPAAPTPAPQATTPAPAAPAPEPATAPSVADAKPTPAPEPSKPAEP